jgi:hypothetical protein
VGILGKLFGRRSARRAPDPLDTLPAPKLGSPAAGWLRRAEKSSRALAELRDSRRSDGPLIDVYSDVATGADDLVAELRRVAGEVTLIEQAIARIPSPALQERHARLTAGGVPADPIAASGREQELAEVTDQLATDRRLRANRDELLARMESGATAMDGLVARAAELSTASATANLPAELGGDITAEAHDLRDRLDAVRIGLAETDEATRRAIGAPPPDGN